MKHSVTGNLILFLFMVFGYCVGHHDGYRAALEPRVMEKNDATVMQVGQTLGAQTVSRRDGGATHLYYDWAGLVDVFMPGVSGPSVLMLGLGGGEMIHVLRKTKPSAQVTAVEVDDRVIKMALRYFPQNVKDVDIVEMDAARYMSRKCPARFDVIIVDVFEAENLPEHFTSAAFFSDVERCLLPRGMVIMNVYPRSLVKETAAAMREVGLEDVTAFPVMTTGNVILWAVRHDDWGDVQIPDTLRPGFERRWSP